ncbi:hypothetical protein F2Q69_00015059 [Brassica cretica]|uniref:Uncharacterized protein n=1 Tax=Brassica cretica TaxID=69181 RepID=A0A8S9QXQ4_BRACR|nr:hypothetical protein F2Q69_00015059 [Brassica cretica]
MDNPFSPSCDFNQCVIVWLRAEGLASKNLESPKFFSLGFYRLKFISTKFILKLEEIGSLSKPVTHDSFVMQPAIRRTLNPDRVSCSRICSSSRPRSASAQGVPDPSSDVRDPRAAPARDLFLVRDSIRQLASDDQGVPDQATKDVRDPIEATRSIPARVPFVSSSRLNSFGGPIQQSSKVKR